ncbi:MAG: hypothetical protein OXC37_04450 [Bdellovibrionaceae bacterium]|nr:hypothetical protein [Pseudobdellovibrionaceae bacterium]
MKKATLLFIFLSFNIFANDPTASETQSDTEAGFCCFNLEYLKSRSSNTLKMIGKLSDLLGNKFRQMYLTLVDKDNREEYIDSSIQILSDTLNVLKTGDKDKIANIKQTFLDSADTGHIIGDCVHLEGANYPSCLKEKLLELENLKKELKKDYIVGNQLTPYQIAFLNPDHISQKFKVSPDGDNNFAYMSKEQIQAISLKEIMKINPLKTEGVLSNLSDSQFRAWATEENIERLPENILKQNIKRIYPEKRVRI